MKIRTVTAGITLDSHKDLDSIGAAARFNAKARAAFERAGFAVQTLRIATNPFPEYMPGERKALLSAAKNLDAACAAQGVDFFSLGPAGTPGDISGVSKIIAGTERLSCSAVIADKRGPAYANIGPVAEAVLNISRTTKNGYGNFRFCAIAQCPPGIAFFPAAYHRGEAGFSLGLECGDLAVKAFAGALDLLDAETRLRQIFTFYAEQVQSLAEELAVDQGFAYLGLDASLAPGLDEEAGVARAFENLGLEFFGAQGTLAAAAMITRTLQGLPVKLCGYSGLMLPVCEDRLLARRADEGRFGLTELLLYSAVCGTGLDTVPLPGDTPKQKIESLLVDTAALATRLNKPLSARLLVAPGLSSNDSTSFDSPYLVDCKPLAIK